jgi:ABC-type multidrug transport system ATPase subunit
MLLDEPFAGIDPIAVQDLQGIVKKLREQGLGILITDHNVRDTLSITDRAYIMYEGSIKRTGTAVELAADAEVREIYLGNSFDWESSQGGFLDMKIGLHLRRASSCDDAEAPAGAEAAPDAFVEPQMSQESRELRLAE